MIGKRYLGDGVYIMVEDGMLKLTSEDGIRALNTIYLEEKTFVALVKYYEDLSGATVEDADV